MQLVLAGMVAGWPLADPVPADPSQRWQELMQIESFHSLAMIGLWGMIFAQASAIFSYWLASKIVIRGERATFGNAVNVWFLYLVMSTGFFVGLIVAIGISIASPEPWRVLVIFGGLFLLLICTLFFIPSKIYEADFAPALSFILLSVIFTIGVTAAFNIGMETRFHTKALAAEVRALTGKTPAEQNAFFKRLSGKDGTDEIDRMLDAVFPVSGAPIALHDREVAIALLQQKLQARSQTLNPKDLQANVTHRWQLGRYLALLHAVKVERGIP